ncbi:MAG: SGNH/GDSL hydrolase family protein [Longimicrobiales bacterium]
MSRRAGQLLALAVSFVIALLIVEGLVRVLLPEPPILPRNVAAARYGVRRNMPDAEWRLYQPDTYDVRVRINADGQRDDERHAPGSTPDVYRIALLGDSFVFGYGVADSAVVSEVLERRLNSRAGTRFEILNFGVPGFGQAEELLQYRHEIRDYRPDAVVLFYYNNDVADNAISGLFRRDDAGELSPSGSAYLPGVRLSELMYRVPPLRWISQHSEAWNVFRIRLAIVVKNVMRSRRGLAGPTDTEPGAAALTAALIESLLGEAAADGAAPFLFVVPDASGRSNLPVPVDSLRARGIHVIDGTSASRAGDYFANDIHWTPAGHRRAAALLTPAIRDAATGATRDNLPATRVVESDPRR